MKLVQRINTRKKQAIIAQCEKCNRLIEIPYTNTINPHMTSIDLKTVVQCECGEVHNLVIDQENYRSIKSPPVIKPPEHPEDLIKCPRCGSTQFHTGDKGYSVGKAAVGGILIGAVGLLGGLIGSKKTMITCLKCGYRWQAGKK
ncbi:MAG: hypothetical protein WAO30_07665 [Thermacetogeniaceae bacterium]